MNHRHALSWEGGGGGGMTVHLQVRERGESPVWWSTTVNLSYKGQSGWSQHPDQPEQSNLRPPWSIHWEHISKYRKESLLSKVKWAETGEEGSCRPSYFATMSVKKTKQQWPIPNPEAWILCHQMQSRHPSQCTLNPCSSTTPRSFLTRTPSNLYP